MRRAYLLLFVDIVRMFGLYTLTVFLHCASVPMIEASQTASPRVDETLNISNRELQMSSNLGETHRDWTLQSLYLSHAKYPLPTSSRSDVPDRHASNGFNVPRNLLLRGLTAMA